MTGESRVEPARPDDAPAIARLIAASKAAAMPWLAVVHTPEEDLGWVREVLLVEHEVRVIRAGEALAAVLATRPGWIDQLYVAPELRRLGHGTVLLDAAKAASGGHLELWAFARNAPARHFYEAAGFRVVEFTDGADNEEREPDVRYAWTAADAPER